MLIDVKYLADKREEFSFNEGLELPRGDYIMNITAQVDGVIYRRDSDYVVEGKVKTVLNLNCDLCLSAFETKLDFDLNEVYSETPD